MSKLSLILSIAAVLLCTSIIHAQTTSEVADSLELDDIVITASKIPLTQRETTKPVLIIDRQQIERRGGKDLSQLLNEQSGIRINSAYGTPSANKSIYVQGASGEYALILIDGLAVNDPSGSGGAVDLRLLPLDNVERIEIIKGSQSTLYGTDAIAGVVNIITRKGNRDPFRANGRLSYGSYNTLNGSIGIEGEPDDVVSYRLNYARESSDGISAATDPDNSGTFNSDGLQKDVWMGRVSLNPVQSLTLSPFLNYSAFEGDYDADAFSDAENTFTLDQFNPGIHVEAGGDDFQLKGGYNYMRTQRAFLSEFGENEFDGRFHNSDVYGTYRFDDHLEVLAGVNYQDSEMIPQEEDAENASSRILSPYVNLFLKNWNGFNTELGYRHNRHSEYGDNSTLSFAPSYDITPKVKLFTSVGTGFKAPTLSELYGQFGANEDLEPQKSLYFNAGVETYLHDQALKLSAHYFNRRIENLITYTFAEGFINRDEQHDQGLELSVNWQANQNLSVRAHYNYLDGELKTVDDNGEETTTDNLLRRPTHSFGGSIGLQATDNLYFSLDGEFNEERRDLFFNPENNFASEEVILDAYSLVNLHAEYSLPDLRIIFFGDIKNLFDTDFTEVYGFNTIGFTATGGIRFNI